MNVEQRCEQTKTVPALLSALLREFSDITDYHALQENLPRRLADLLNCQCVLLYMHVGETLQFTSGSFDDSPGWSASLLAVAHINPISLKSGLPEARAWNTRQMIAEPENMPILLAAPLLARHECIGVLLALRGEEDKSAFCWQAVDCEMFEAIAGVVALLLENSRLFERDHERIHELSLLNSISSQMNYSLYEMERMRRIFLQRTREIASTDVCALLEPDGDLPEWVTCQLQELLFQRFREQYSLLPLVIERPGDGNLRTSEYVQQLPITIRTFFAVPLLSGHVPGSGDRSLLQMRDGRRVVSESQVLGIIVGGYHHNRKICREELVLLQVLSSQAGTVLENIRLMTEVVEARNEARKLLRQVLDDQRFKELILESIPSGLITTDQKGRITTFNRAAEDILGYHPHEVMGLPLVQLLDFQTCTVLQQRWEFIASQTSHIADQAVLRDVHEHEVCSGVVLSTDRENHELILDVVLLPLYDGHAEPVGTLVTFTDVTSIHHLEEEKRRLDRLASLGEMAANVAHEVRNPLASIKTSMQMLIDDLGSGSPTDWQSDDVLKAGSQESISVVLKEVERLDTLVRELLLFARPYQLRRVKCDVGALSDHILQMLKRHDTQSALVVQRQYYEIPALYADLGQLEQILLNLYMNAIQAMPDGGVLTISFRLLPSEKAIRDAEYAASLQVRQSAALIQHNNENRKWPVKQWLEIAVKDTGVGIPPNQFEQIFQPFFTTKAHGIGLGLAITRRLVEDHGGYMQVEEHTGPGITMAVRLPLIAPEIFQIQEEEFKERAEGGER